MYKAFQLKFREVQGQIKDRHRTIIEKRSLANLNDVEMKRLLEESRSLISANLRLKEVSSERYRSRLENYKNKRFRRLRIAKK
jgi:hypothetical protein